MSNSVKKGTLWSVIVVIVIALGIVLSAVLGFNAHSSLQDAKSLTVTMNKYVYTNELDTVEDICEDVIGDLKVLYEVKSEMTGDECEIVYVFASDVELANVESALQNAFDAQMADGAALEGAFISVSSSSEDVSAVVAKGFVLRGVIAVAVMAVLAFIYVAIRHSLGMGIVAAVSAIVGAGLTVAISVLARIPATSAVAYAVVIGGLFSLVTTLLTLNKVHANLNAEESIEETVETSVPVYEIFSLAILGAAAMLIVGVVSVIGAGALTATLWFAVACVVAMAVSAFVGIVYAPALYVPLKGSVDKNVAAKTSDYVGAKKTSTKVKKAYQKKQAEKPVEEEKAAPCCCDCADCQKEEPAEEAEVVEEEVAEEEVAEEPVEETEEAIEEVVEESAEEEAEVAEEVVEEAPVEEAPATEEAPAEETTEENND